MFKIEQNRACYITCVILCYLTYVMLCYLTCLVMLYNMCRQVVIKHMSCHMTYVQNRTEQNMLYNVSSCYITCHVMLFNICLVML